MTNIYFSFDTEDFTSSKAADGILEVATILKEEGVRGGFNIVGLLAEQLVAWGRTDVLEALSYHEINFHSFGHSLHPCIHEYTNTEDQQTAYNELIRQESAGMAAVRAATGASQLYAACPPGINVNFMAMYAYSDLGIPCYVGGILDTEDGRSMFYCNMLQHYYYDALDWLVPNGTVYDPAYLDKLAKRKNVIIYNHPNMLVYRTFWDAVNYYDGVNHVPFGQWNEAEPLTEQEREAYRTGIRSFIRALKADGRFRFRTFKEEAEERCFRTRTLLPEDMADIHAQLRDRFYPVEKPDSFCISDIFAAAAKFLRGDKRFAAGRVYGFLDTPYAITQPVTVKAEDVKKAAAQVDLRTFLPTSFDVGGVKLGPADFLYAILEALEGKDSITLTPREQNIDMTGLGGCIENPDLGGWMFAPDFHPDIIEKRTPLQAWTIRF